MIAMMTLLLTYNNAIILQNKICFGIPSSEDKLDEMMRSVEKV